MANSLDSRSYWVLPLNGMTMPNTAPAAPAVATPSPSRWPISAPRLRRGAGPRPDSASWLAAPVRAWCAGESRAASPGLRRQAGTRRTAPRRSGSRRRSTSDLRSRGRSPACLSCRCSPRPLDSDGQRVEDEQRELGARAIESAQQDDVDRGAESEHGRDEHKHRKERVDSEVIEQRVAEVRGQDREDRLGEFTVRVTPKIIA